MGVCVGVCVGGGGGGMWGCVCGGVWVCVCVGVWVGVCFYLPTVYPCQYVPVVFVPDICVS